jgi:hypothetical protein
VPLDARACEYAATGSARASTIRTSNFRIGSPSIARFHMAGMREL